MPSQTSAEARTRAALERIEALNPRLNAVIAVDPTAIDQARALDRGRRARGPLYGMPMLIKDNIETAGPLPTTAGSLALRQCHRPRRAAGGAAARGRRGDRRQGQSFANGRISARPIRSPAGARSAARRAIPYALDRNPCGSQLGQRGGGRGGHGAGGDRHRDRRLDHLPGGDQRHRRLQADASAWSAAPMSCRSATARTRRGR